MDDKLSEQLAGTAAPRELSPSFREQLERAILDEEADAPMWRIDGPRPMPPEARARLERAMTRRRSTAWMTRRRSTAWMTRGVAAATALILATAALVVIERTGAKDGGGFAAPAPGFERPVQPDLSPAPARPPGSLRTFSSSASFLAYVRDLGVELTGPYGLRDYDGYAGPAPIDAGSDAGDGPVAPGLEEPPSPEFPTPQTQDAGGHSRTNVQEEGVDEPDLVQTDGRRLAVLNADRLRILAVGGARPRLVSSTPMPEGLGLFLIGDRLVHFGVLTESAGRAKRAHAVPGRTWTKMTVLDISRPAAPRIENVLEVEGVYVGARLVDGVIRMILRSDALGPAPVYPLSDDYWSDDAVARAAERNKRRIRASNVGDWLPHFIVKRPGRPKQTGHVHSWNAVSRPPDRAGLGMLTVLTIDPADPRPGNAASVIGSGEIVYASTTSLYVTSSRIDGSPERDLSLVRAPVTRIHRFDITDPARSRYVGSGVVPGHLLNQFSLSEHDGYLRAATTLDQPSDADDTEGQTESVVTVMRLGTRALPKVGSVGDLGKGERIYAVRFMGARGYVVTFRQIDPLYVIDLSDPRAPRVLGELKVPGYSGYLHPLGDELLLGVGNDTDENGAQGGIQFSLFDVSDASDPVRLHARVVGTYGWTSVTDDHHAFLYWAPRSLTVVPATLADPESAEETFAGALALEVDRRSGFSKPARISHTDRPHDEDLATQITRSLVIGDRLLTLSAAGILVSDLDTLDEQRWVRFPR